MCKPDKTELTPDENMLAKLAHAQSIWGGVVCSSKQLFATMT